MMSTQAEKPAELRYAFTLSGVIAMRMLGLFLILPVFMVLSREVPGYSAPLAGLAIGIYGLTQAVLQQPFGRLSDRIGRRPVMVLGLLLFAAGGVVAATAETMTGLVFGRALQGCGAIAGVALAFAADLSRPEKRPIAMAIIGMGIGGAFLLSMGLSVPLANWLGLSGLFWLTVVLAVIGIGLVHTVPAAAVLPPDPAEGQQPGKRQVWLLSLSVFLLHAVMTLLFVTLPSLLENELALGLSDHWKVYVPAMVGSVILMLPVLRITGRRQLEHRLLGISFLLIALMLAAIPHAPGLLGLGFAVTLYFVGFNLLEASMPSLLSRHGGSGSRGRRMGFYSTFQFLGAFAGGALGGLLLDAMGGHQALMLGGAISLAWFIVIMVLKRRLFPTEQGS